MQQRFPLPTLPFARDLHSGCVVGTSITLVAQPFDDRRKSFTLTLLTVSGETPLRCEGRVGERGHVGLSSVTNGTESSEVTAPASFSTAKEFTLTINVKERVFEVFVNSVYCLEYLHRVEPLLARRLECDGPMSVKEVVVTPASVETLPPPPAYDQLNDQMGGMGIGGAAPSLSYPPPALATLPVEKNGGAAPTGYPPTTAPPNTLIHKPALANRPNGKDAVRGGSTAATQPAYGNAPGVYPGYPPPPTVSGTPVKPLTTTPYPGSSAPANSQYGNPPPAYPNGSCAPVSTAPYSTLPAKPVTTTSPYPGGSSTVPANSQPTYGNTGTYPPATTAPYSGEPVKPVTTPYPGSSVPANSQPIYGNTPYPGAAPAPYPPTTNPANTQSVYGNTPPYAGAPYTPYPPSTKPATVPANTTPNYGNVQSSQSGVGFKPQYSGNQSQSAGLVSAGASVADKAAFLEARLDRSRLESMRASGMNGQASGYGGQQPQPYPPPPPPQVPGGGYPIGQGAQGYPPAQPYPPTFNGAPPPQMGAGALPNPPMTNINPAFYGGPQYRGGTPSPPPPPQPIPGQYNYLAGRVPPTYNNYPPTTQYPGYVGVGAAPVMYQQSYGGYAYPGYGGATVYGAGGGCESAHYRRRRSSSSSCSDRC